MFSPLPHTHTHTHNSTPTWRSFCRLWISLTLLASLQGNLIKKSHAKFSSFLSQSGNKKHSDWKHYKHRMCTAQDTRAPGRQGILGPICTASVIIVFFSAYLKSQERYLKNQQQPFTPLPSAKQCRRFCRRTIRLESSFISESVIPLK